MLPKYLLWTRYYTEPSAYLIYPQTILSGKDCCPYYTDKETDT